MNMGVVFYEFATFLKYLGIQMDQCKEKCYKPWDPFFFI